MQNGIEVWSAVEGQQRFDAHVDKLLNYIRYWQASGESIKTSMRVKTRLEQLTESGHFTGGITNGEAKSEVIPELQIIDEETSTRARELMTQRTTHHAEVPLNLKGQSLLVGNIFCGHCRNRLTLTTSGRKRVTRDGSIHRETRYRYQCHYNVRHPGECDGQSGYGVKKLDGIIDRIVRYQLSKISASDCNDIVREQHEKSVEFARARLNMTALQLAEKERELKDYQAETIKVIRGQSGLSRELLNTLVQEAEQERKDLLAAVETARRELDEYLNSSKAEQKELEKLKSWADLYDSCNFAAKKMIVHQFIKSVYVYRDYTIEVEFNVSFEEFKTLATECEDKNPGEQPVVYVTA